VEVLALLELVKHSLFFSFFQSELIHKSSLDEVVLLGLDFSLAISSFFLIECKGGSLCPEISGRLLDSLSLRFRFRCLLRFDCFVVLSASIVELCPAILFGHIKKSLGL